MSTSKKAVPAIVAAVTALGVVAVIYAVRVIAERSSRQVITSQVDTWAEGWLAARACLAGSEPALSRPGEAFLVHQATHVGAAEQARACERSLRTLTRPGDGSTDDPAVEAAWHELLGKVKGLAQAYAGILDPSTTPAMRQHRQARVAAAMDGVEAAHAALRDVARMDPAPAQGAASAAQLGAGTVIAQDSAPLVPRTVLSVGGTVVIQGQLQGAPALALLGGPDRIAVHVLDDGTMRAADEAAWGIWFRPAAGDLIEMRAGALGPASAPAEDGVTVVRTRSVSEDIIPHMALGRGPLRAVVFRTVESRPDAAAGGLFLARSTDGGATWSAPVRIADRALALHMDYGRRRVDLALADAGGSVRWQPLRADALDRIAPPRRIHDGPESADLLQACAGDQASWWLRAQATVYHVPDSGAAHAIQLPERVTFLDACSDEQALLSRVHEGGEELIACDRRACTSLLRLPLVPGDQRRRTLGARAGAVAVTQIATLLVVQRPDAAPAAFVAEDGQRLEAVVEWDGALHAILSTDADIRLVPLPLP